MHEVVSRRQTDRGCEIALVRYPAGAHQASHAHDLTTVSLVLRGALEERVGGDSVRGGAFDLVIKPRGTRHENRYLAADTMLVRVAPADETIRQAIDAGCPLGRWTWTDGTAAARAMAGLARLVGSDVDSECLQGIVEEALASLGLPQATREAGRPPVWLRRVREALDEAGARSVPHLSITELAEDAGVHRVHLSREFRRYFGVSPTEYRMRTRLRAAARRIGTSTQSLSGAAYGSGFADQAHMTREFRRWLGLTPLEYRRLAPSSTAAG
jgi:AraC family transcriptional regulator